MSEAQTIDTMKPDDELTVMIHDAHNAGKTPSSRWGKIAFDAKGDAELKCKVKDLPVVDSLGWLSAEDRERYLGVAQEVIVEADTSKLTEELAAMQGANTRLASKNASLEAELEAQTKRFDASWKQSQDEHAAAMKAKDEELSKLSAALSESQAKLAASEKTLDETQKALAKAEKKAK